MRGCWLAARSTPYGLRWEGLAWLSRNRTNCTVVAEPFPERPVRPRLGSVVPAAWLVGGDREDVGWGKGRIQANVVGLAPPIGRTAQGVGNGDPRAQVHAERGPV